jgi:hypothetical protein
MDWIQLAIDEVQWQPFEHDNRPSSRIKGGEFINQLSDNQILKKDFVPWILLVK